MCMNPLHLFQSKFLHDEEKIMKKVSKPTFKNITRDRDHSQMEYIKKKIEYSSPVYVGVTILELSKIHMFELFYNILQPSLKDLTLHYMDKDSFILSYSDGKVSDEHMDLSNLDIPIKTNNKVPGKFKHELGSRIFEELIALSPKTYSFKNYPKNTKEKGIKKHNNARHIDYIDALMNNTQRTVDESRIQKVGDNMTTTKTSKISLNIFDDKRFYVNNIKSYPHDKELFIFKRDLLNRIRERTSSVVIQQASSVASQAASPIKKLYKDNDVDKMICEQTSSVASQAGSLINDITELTIDSNRKLIEAAIILYNELSAKQLEYQGLRPFY